MKTKTTMAIVLLLLVTNAMSYFLGSHGFYISYDTADKGTIHNREIHCYNLTEALSEEKDLKYSKD